MNITKLNFAFRVTEALVFHVQNNLNMDNIQSMESTINVNKKDVG